MKAILARYRRYQALKANSRTYKIARVFALSLAGAYILLLCFPQVLFAHEMTYKSFTVYSRTPLDDAIYVVLDRAESRLAASPIYSGQVKPKLVLVNSSRSYAALSLYLGSNSFGKGYMLVKHLLEYEKLSVDDLFGRDFDTDALADVVFRRL